MQFENTVDYQQPSLEHVEPVLPVRDVMQTINYWHEVLGFQTQWLSGTPPTLELFPGCRSCSVLYQQGIHRKASTAVRLDQGAPAGYTCAI